MQADRARKRPMKNNVRAVIEAYSPPVSDCLLALRDLILQTAEETPGVGSVEEDLRWGQPSFLTPETGSGSTIRIDGVRNNASKYAIYFHCQTGLVDEFRAIYATNSHLLAKERSNCTWASNFQRRRSNNALRSHSHIIYA